MDEAAGALADVKDMEAVRLRGLLPLLAAWHVVAAGAQLLVKRYRRASLQHLHLQSRFMYFCF